MKLSNCCGAEPRMIHGDGDTEDIGICPDCREHCEYVDDDNDYYESLDDNSENGCFVWFCVFCLAIVATIIVIIVT